MIESKGGESIKGMTIKDPELIEFGRLVAETLPIWGPANVQCFRVADGRLEVTDVNPRFGGGFPLPLAAGSRYPELALALARGERPEPRLGDFREGVMMTRFFSDLCLTAGAGGTLEPFAEELPEPIAERARRDCELPPRGRLALAAACRRVRFAARLRRAAGGARRPRRSPDSRTLPVVVTVVDGDTGRRVRGALVRIGGLGRPREPARERRDPPARRAAAPRDGRGARLRSRERAHALPAPAPRWSSASTGPSSSGRCTARPSRGRSRSRRSASGRRSGSSGAAASAR